MHAPGHLPARLARLSVAMDTNVPWPFLIEDPQANCPRLWRHILTTLKTVTETASELRKEARESLEELGRSAGKRLDDARDETAGTLHTAASSVRRTGRQGSAAIDSLAMGTADRLDAAASYVEDHGLKDVFTGLRRFGRRHLTGSLVFAVAIGFLAGAALNRAAQSCGRTSEGT